MLTMFSLFLLFAVLGAFIKLALKMTWGLVKVILGIVVLPIIALILIFSGIYLLAIPVLLVLGIVALGKLLIKI